MNSIFSLFDFVSAFDVITKEIMEKSTIMKNFLSWFF